MESKAQEEFFLVSKLKNIFPTVFSLWTTICEELINAINTQLNKIRYVNLKLFLCVVQEQLFF
jgi:hypothetical protein